MSLVRVNLINPLNGEECPVKIPSDKPIGQIVHALIRRLQLPTVNTFEEPIAYYLVWDTGNQFAFLDNQNNLADYSISDDSVLCIVSNNIDSESSDKMIDLEISGHLSKKDLKNVPRQLSIKYLLEWLPKLLRLPRRRSDGASFGYGIQLEIENQSIPVERNSTIGAYPISRVLHIYEEAYSPKTDPQRKRDLMDAIRSLEDIWTKPNPLPHASNNVTSQREWDYLDFDLKIISDSDGGYRTLVLFSPAGQAEENWHSSLSDIRSSKNLGRDLFETLIAGEIRNRYDVSLERARNCGKGLRLKLRIESPVLTDLPWELMYDPRRSEHVSLCCQTPLVRYLDIAESIKPLGIEPPLRILGIIANPTNHLLPGAEAEKQQLEDALRDLIRYGKVELEWLDGQTWRHLQRAFWRSRWNVLHFIGYGGFDHLRNEGFLVLSEEENKSSHVFWATKLGTIVSGHESLRFAFLNMRQAESSHTSTAFSQIATTLMRRGIPAVLGLQNKLEASFATELTRTLYTALADGLPVDSAVTQARIAISFSDDQQGAWATPVLYMRSPDGRLFNVR